MKIYRVANAAIGCAIFLVAVVLVYVVSIHHSKLTDLSGAIRYLVLPGGLLALLIFSFKLPAARRVNIALALFATGFALYGLEASLHITEWYSRARVQRYIRAHSDTRSRLEIIKDIEAQTGERAWPYPVPLYLGEGIDIEGDTVLPLAGISGATTVFCNESGTMAIYKADEHGFNNPAGLHSEKAIEAVLVGDSFAHGACVPTEHNVAGHLRARNRSAINLGFSGNGPLLALATIKEFAVPLRPKAVIWLYFEGNDLAELELERSSQRLMRYLGDDGHQNLRSRQEEIDRALKDLFEALRRDREREEANPPKKDFDWMTYLNSQRVTSWLLLRKLRSSVSSGFRMARRVLDKDSPEHCIHDLSLFASILRDASQSVASAGGQFYFAYLPTWERYRNRYPPGLCREQVLALVRAEGIPVTDIDSVFRSTGDPLSLFALTWAAGHYTPEGYRLVAESIDRLVN